jgi:hypothetical protein
MSQPFSRIPEPETSRPFKRRLQPHSIQQAARDAWRVIRRQGENTWQKVKRRPRTVGLIAGAAALTLVGAYTLSASGVGRSLCPTSSQPSGFVLLLDPVAHPVAPSKLEVRYDVCGLPAGTGYRARVQVTSQRVAKKGSAKSKPLVVTFQDKVDGVATRRARELELGRLKPGAYTLELSVTDNKGRERKRLQKIQVKAR